jgi:hypothetical protein
MDAITCISIADHSIERSMIPTFAGFAGVTSVRNG